MEEILKAAKEYYATCVDARLFGLKGTFYILLGTPFLIASIYVGMSYKNLAPLIVLIQVIGMLCWREAKKNYDKKLKQRLIFITDQASDELSSLKVKYLSNLTAPIGTSLFEVMNNIISMNGISEKNKPLSPDNFGHFVSKFIYDPEAKSRILSLTIYLISLTAILLVIKPNTQVDIYGIIAMLEFSDILAFFLYTATIILFVYFIIFMPLSMVATYLFRPLMLMKANQRILIRYFISELSKYAFSDHKQLEEKPPHTNSKTK